MPETPWKLACSTEFAVLRVKGDRTSPWLLLLLLRSDSVQAQIRTLTSGTSSSHNRIKDRDLATITIPVPTPGSKAMAKLTAVAGDFKRATQLYYTAIKSMTDSFLVVEKLLAE